MTPERTERLYRAMGAFYARCWELSRTQRAVQRVRARLEDEDDDGNDLRPLLTGAEAGRLEDGCRAALAGLREDAAKAAAARIAQLRGDPVLRAKVFGGFDRLYQHKGSMTAGERGEELHNVFQYVLVDQAPGVGGAAMMEAWQAALAGWPAPPPEALDASVERALREAVLLALRHATTQGTLANAVHFVRCCRGLSPAARAECERAWEAARHDVELLEHFHRATQGKN